MTTLDALNALHKAGYDFTANLAIRQPSRLTKRRAVIAKFCELPMATKEDHAALEAVDALLGGAK